MGELTKSVVLAHTPNFFNGKLAWYGMVWYGMVERIAMKTWKFNCRL